MNCHKSVAVNSPHIKKLTEAYNNDESIPWVKVHMLPDFVHFPHNAHIKKLANGSKAPEEVKQACFQCHGKIDQMTEVFQTKDLSMGWCLECHRKPESNGPQNCSACHY
ncbi:MAG: cytochrome c3 [Bdellovibrionales bacterium]|nr:cytochrome c3 [Bdellovibrionales bacterium]